MNEEDWAHTFAVFQACLPRRGCKAEDDRRLLEALHFFTIEKLRLRALSERFRRWNSVWKRFDRLSKAGVFEAFFDTLASMSSSANLIQMFDLTIVARKYRPPAPKEAREGYAGKVNRAATRARGIAPVIPHKANEKDKPKFFARTRYKARARIERGIGRIERFKRIVLRCERTARNFRSVVSFAAGLRLIKFVHTA